MSVDQTCVSQVMYACFLHVKRAFLEKLSDRDNFPFPEIFVSLRE